MRIRGHEHGGVGHGYIPPHGPQPHAGSGGARDAWPSGGPRTYTMTGAGSDTNLPRTTGGSTSIVRSNTAASRAASDLNTCGVWKAVTGSVSGFTAFTSAWAPL